jgi:hypothetical protein
MGEPLKTGLKLVLLGLFFAGVFAFNMKTGEAFIKPLISPERRTNPIGFWLIQGFIGLIALAGLVGGALVLLGLSPP